jgi:SAM-dependent methyltransferase
MSSSLYKSVKSVVPLPLKEGYHKHKSAPHDMAARVVSRLKGRPAIPPGKLIHLVAGHKSAKAFLAGGRSASDTIRGILGNNGLQIEQFGAVLDFGCGVGRIMRHWNSTRGPAWHGTDYNPDLIAWCRKNLPFAEFGVNTLSGPLSYDAKTFDFIYAFSVFTHLKEPLQFHWINELARVLKPGGYLYLTTHGEHYVSVLNAEERAQFERGELVVREQQESGSNRCAVFHPPSYMRERVAKDFTVVDFIPCGAQGDSMHDAYLLRKPLPQSA